MLFFHFLLSLRSCTYGSKWDGRPQSASCCAWRWMRGSPGHAGAQHLMPAAHSLGVLSPSAQWHHQPLHQQQLCFMQPPQACSGDSAALTVPSAQQLSLIFAALSLMVHDVDFLRPLALALVISHVLLFLSTCLIIVSSRDGLPCLLSTFTSLYTPDLKLYISTNKCNIFKVV